MSLKKTDSPSCSSLINRKPEPHGPVVFPIPYMKYYDTDNIKSHQANILEVAYWQGKEGYSEDTKTYHTKPYNHT